MHFNMRCNIPILLWLKKPKQPRETSIPSQRSPDYY